MTSIEFMNLVNTGNCTGLNLNAEVGHFIDVSVTIDGKHQHHVFDDMGLLKKIESPEEGCISLYCEGKVLEIEGTLLNP